jgi:phosphohistidine phosphatase
MNLYVVRHGEAVALGGAVRHDGERSLTERGREDARRVGEFLAKLEPSLRFILSSPMVRARQSAEAVAQAFSPPVPIQETEHLAPGFKPDALRREIRSIDPEESIAMIGHQPDLSQFIISVIEGESGASIALAAGGVAKLHFVGGALSEATLEWLLTPEVLRQFTLQV